jgi:uncharacterized Zn-binding protein involved in type VI secretion
MGRAVTFFGAADIPHCSGMVRFGKSTNVKVGGIGVSRQGDINTPHLLPGLPCPAHAAPIAIGSLKVKVNGRGCGRMGDSISGCTSVAQGHPKVFAG